MKTTVEKSPINVTCVNIFVLSQVLFGPILKHLTKPNKCNQCDFAAGVLTHCKEKSQKCNQRDFACHNQGNLIINLRIHNGDKPYHCNQCDFACSRANILNVHVN